MRVHERHGGGYSAITFKWHLVAFVLLTALFAWNDANAFTFTLDVKDETGAAVSGFRYLVEEDTTHPVNLGTHDPNSLGTSIHRSYAPVVTNGETATGSAVITVPDGKRYAVSILSKANEYTMSGAHVADQQTSVTVYVNRLPIPTAQISVFVFNDNHPIDNAPNQPFEQGLQDFSVIIFDQLGQMSQDAFGNPLGTTYQFDIAGNPLTDPVTGAYLVDMMGSGEIKTDANGEALVKYLPPGKYGIRVVPPHNQNWYQTSTIEGTPGIDAWVKANEPTRLFEFGPALYHVFIGFVQKTNLLNTIPVPVGGSKGTITGKVVTIHSSRPPALTFYEGYPVPECWIGLNTAAGEGIYVAQCNPDSTFTINNVPPGTYQLVTWDTPLDYIFGFTTVIVPTNGGTVNLGNVAMNAWFATYEGSVFYDANMNGKRDNPMTEPGISNQTMNIRFRDGSMYQTQPTDVSGEFSFVEVFPFFRYLIYEVDYARYKPTGATLVVDDGGPLAPGAKNNPQIQPGGLPYRTELGPVLLEAMTLYADQTNTIEWGKVPYAAGENGGIAGIVYYATTRAEDDPRYAAADGWEPGIPRVQVNLYQDADGNGAIDNINGVPGIQLADVDNYPFDNFPGPEDVDRNSNGVFNLGDALDYTHTDSWDDNLPTGCVGPPQTVYGQPIIDCAETLQTWNQARPAVFDGGYAFGSLVGVNLAPGTYIIEAVPPYGYETVKEEDKNVVFGESYEPSPLLLPAPCVNNDENGGLGHHVPPELSLYPGEPAFYAGQYRPLCDRKQVVLTNGKNAAADFFMFTMVPKSARGVGIINNDLAIEGRTGSPITTEKFPASWIPISVQDFRGKELLRAYTDEWGYYNFLVPSTFTTNPPIPTGVSPSMLRLCLNHPGPIPNPGNPSQLIPDPNFNPQFSLTCYTFDFWPAKTTYLDTPVIPVSAFAGAITATLDCEYPDGTPIISDVTGPGAVGPYASAANGTVQITIMSPGTLNVPNPSCAPFDNTCVKTVSRDYGFGTTQGSGSVSVGNIHLTITSWGNTVITGNVPAGMTTGQLVVTRGNGKSSVEGITLTVGGPSPTVINPGPGNPIQTAIDAAGSDELIIARPGEYNELLIMWKKVRLQGSSSFSTILNAAAITPEKMQLWRNKIDGLISGGFVSLIPGEDPNLQLETAGITVIANNSVFTSNPRARIDGFKITSATAGGGISVNGYAHYLEISNNRIFNNAGTYAGGIRIGTPSLLDASCVDSLTNPTYCSSQNDHISIHNNHIAQNGAVGGIIGGGGIGIYNGADLYEIRDNYLCGNFTGNKGGGIAHFGLSKGGTIAYNKILFNESSFGTNLGGEGGGIMIAGEPAPVGGTGGLTPGSGNVTVEANLIQGNIAGSDSGGGILLSFVNGQDVLAARNNSTNWHTINIFNNMIVNNVAGFTGGGIYLEDTAKSRIINNTVSNNYSTATGANAFGGSTTLSTPQGAGIVSNLHSAGLTGAIGTGTAQEFNRNFSNPVLFNNIVWQNRSFYWDSAQATNPLGGLVANPTTPFWDLQVFGSATFKLNPQYCILTSATGYAGTNRGGTANDPRFVAPYLNNLLAASAPGEGGNFIQVTFSPLTPAGDYHIQTGSPAINGGSNLLLSLVSTDYDRQNRPNSGVVDIGADENYAGIVTTYSISGTVRTALLLPVSGVTVRLTGVANATATTNASGVYIFTGLSNGNYTVTPSQTGRTFTPATRNVTINNANVNNINFTRN
jgi:large repetitive protein